MAELLPEEEELQLAMAMSLSYLDNDSEDSVENVSTTIPSVKREISEEVTVNEDFSTNGTRFSFLVKTIEKKKEDLTCPVPRRTWTRSMPGWLSSGSRSDRDIPPQRCGLMCQGLYRREGITR